MKTLQTFATLIFALGSTILIAQDSSFNFEVASVKPSGPAPATRNGDAMRLIGGPGSPDPEHLRYSRASMLRLLATSFLIQADQIAGPDWVKTEDGPDRFDIAANVPAGATREQMAAMMLNLLKERFHLAWHVEKKDFDVFELVVARNGSKLKAAEIPGTLPELPEGPLNINRGSDGFPILPAGSTMGEGATADGHGSMYLGLQALNGFQFVPPLGSRMPGMGLTRFTLRNVTIKQLIGFALRYMDSSHVMDRTGLTGNYDVKVAFGTGTRPGASTDDASEPSPDVLNAFEKQLGLKFQKARAPLDVIVVDRIDKVPTDN